MKKPTIMAVAAMLALTGCDQLGLTLPGGGKDDANAANAVAPGNQSAAAGGKPTAGGASGTQVADAGVTNSRSLQAMSSSGGKPGAGGGGGAGGINAELLTGSWTDNGDCDMAVDIFTDGTFTSWNGGNGNWVLNGNVLTMSGPGGSFTLRLQQVDSDTLVVTNPDGSVGRSTRC